MWFALLPINVVGLRQDIFDTKALFGFSWLNIVLASTVIASVLVIAELGWYRWRKETSGPEFDVQLGGVVSSVSRMKVINKSDIRANITARAFFEALIAHDLSQTTEHFSLVFEENGNSGIDLNPGDHGTIPLIQYKKDMVGNDEMHWFELYSQRHGEPHSFPFRYHSKTQAAVTGIFTIRVYSTPKIKGRHKWRFEFSDIHPDGSWTMRDINSPIRHWWQIRLRRRKADASPGATS